MTVDNRVKFFIDGLNQLIDYNRKENMLNYAEAIGALEIVKQDLVAEVRGWGEEAEPDA